MKFGGDDLLIMEIIFTKFHQKIHPFTPLKSPICIYGMYGLVCMGNVPYVYVCLLLHLYTHTTADLMVSGLNLPKLVFGWNSNVFLLLIGSMPAIFFD